ncbi:hypothetical protein [Vallitalea guaymasensis]|uniref:hypothetical protein n=1 Tax=Vallitalea guaymasensis TaxID=1185412 RepID=UPI000DE53927|nr:hypothetical protein [Vallitalea guaymasensis]
MSDQIVVLKRAEVPKTYNAILENDLFLISFNDQSEELITTSKKINMVSKLVDLDNEVEYITELKSCPICNTKTRKFYQDYRCIDGILSRYICCYDCYNTADEEFYKIKHMNEKESFDYCKILFSNLKDKLNNKK